MSKNAILQCGYNESLWMKFFEIVLKSLDPTFLVERLAYIVYSNSFKIVQTESAAAAY